MIKDLASENVNLEKWKFMYTLETSQYTYSFVCIQLCIACPLIRINHI